MPEVSLMPVAKQQFFDSSGNPLAAGNVYFYETGTSTEKTVYSDSNGTTALSNPVTLDSAGRASIWLDGYYKTVVKDANGTTIYTTDNISSQFHQTTNTVQFVDQDDTFTYISGTQFSLTGNETSTYSAGRRIKATVTAGTVYGTITTSSAGGDPVITTVTVVIDSGALDSGLSAIAIGILTASNPSIPVLPLSTKTANYTLLGTDLNKKILMSANGIALTVPAANGFPSGFEFDFVNIGANQLEVTGTINGFANVTFLQYESTKVFGDGTSWYSQNMHNQDAVGTVKWWSKSLSGVPQTLPWGWVECTGQVVSDSESPANGQTLPNINGDGRFIRGANTSGNEQANQNLAHLHGSGSISLANGDVNGASFAQEQIGGAPLADIILGAAADANGANTGVLLQGLDSGFQQDQIWIAPATAGGGGFGVPTSVTGNTANAGNTEARPDNVSMVAIIKIK